MLGAVLGLGILIVLYRACDPGLFMCADQDVASIPSPGGDYRAHIYTRDCGATTTEATHVALVKTRWLLPNETEIVYVADYGDGAIPPGKDTEVRVHWVSETEMVVAHHEGVVLWKTAASALGVSIRHESSR